MANYKKWSIAEKQYIQEHLQSFTDKELGDKLSGMTGEKISSAMIRRQRRKIGISKNRGRPRTKKASDITPM